MLNSIRQFVVAIGLMLAVELLAVAVEPGSEGLFKSLDANNDGQVTSEEVPDTQAALFSRLLRTSDADEDGKLSAAEFSAGLQPARRAKPMVEKASSELPGADALKLLLAKMDVNRDQKLEEKEIPKEFLGFFDRLEERSGGKVDGQITRRELVQSAPKLCQLAQRYANQQGIDVEEELARLPKEQRLALDRADQPARPIDMLSDPEQVKQLFARWDADGNGQVSREELPERIVNFFDGLIQRHDDNDDGQLSKKELMAVSRRFSAGKRDLKPKQVEQEVAKMLKRFDRNNDKQLSLEEAPQRMADRFERVDTNGDGEADREELGRVVKLLRRLRKPEK